jgi:hypothetical protein
MIWPSVFETYVHGNIAIFRAESGGELFAVQPPGPPMEISIPVIRHWSKETGKDDAEVELVGFTTNENQMEFNLAVRNHPEWHEIVLLDWNQIADMMREVKEKGVERQDSMSGTPFIEEQKN